MASNSTLVVLLLLFRHLPFSFAFLTSSGGAQPRISVGQLEFGPRLTHAMQRNQAQQNEKEEESSSGVRHFQLCINYGSTSGLDLRSVWMAQEVLTTFAKEPSLAAVSIIPRDVGLAEEEQEEDFRVTLNLLDPLPESSSDSSFLVYDLVQTEANEHPELKRVKQRIRDIIVPSLDLGHSESRKAMAEVGDSVIKTTKIQSEQMIDLSVPVEPPPPQDVTSVVSWIDARTELATLPHVAFSYCTGCRWMLRASYLSQELARRLQQSQGGTENQTLAVSLLPNRSRPGGIFTVTFTLPGQDPVVLWNRKVDGGFPEPEALYNRLLPHLWGLSAQTVFDANDDDDDEEAMEARRYFGVL